MMKLTTMTVTVLVTMTVIAASPGNAQSLLDTIHQLGATARQLGGKKVPSEGDVGPGQRNGATAPMAGRVGREDDGEIVPASVLADDASDTALERTVTAPRRIETFDIRDLRLGMSPREFGPIAGRQGFRRRWNSIFFTSGSFEVEAAQIANRQLNRPLHKTAATQLKAVQGFDPAGDELKADFTLEPSGPKLSKITYYARLNGMTTQQTFDALARKYGVPIGQQILPDVRGWTNGVSSPALHAVVDGDHLMLTLEQSLNYMQAAQKRLNDRAQQLAAAGGGGVKF